MTKYQIINENIYNFELRIGEAWSLELGDGSFIFSSSGTGSLLNIHLGSFMPYVYYQKDCIIQYNTNIRTNKHAFCDSSNERPCSLISRVSPMA